MCVPQSFALFLLAASSNTQIREPVLTGDGCPLGGINHRFGGSIYPVLGVHLDTATVYQNIESLIIAVTFGGGSNAVLQVVKVDDGSTSGFKLIWL